MNDLYLIKNSNVLKNLLGITDEKELDVAEVKLFCSFEDYTKACAYYSAMAISVLPMGNGNSHYIVSENEVAVAQGHYIMAEDNSETYLLYFQSKEDLSKIYAIKLAGFTKEEAQEIFRCAVIR